MDKANQPRIITSDKKWLIRSSSKILGPFTVQEVTQLIAARQVSIIDEVKQPLERWTYIREYPVFVELVKALRNEQETSVEHTMATSTTTSQTQRLGMTRTDVLFNDDRTPPPTDPSIKDVKVIREVKIGQQSTSSDSGAKSYGVANDPRIFQRKKEFERKLKISLVVVIFSLVAALYLRHFMREKEKAESLTKIEKIAHLHFTQGLGKSALAGFKKVMQLRGLSEDYTYDYAILLAHSGETVEGRRRIEALLAKPEISRDRKVELLNVLGSSYLEEGNLTQAADSFRKSQAFDSSNLNSQLNSIQLKMAQKQFVEAFKLGQQILLRYPKEPELKVLMNLAAIEALKAGNSIDNLGPYLLEQRRTLLQRNYLAQELSLTYLYLNLLNEKAWNENFEQLLWQVLSSNLFQREQFSENFSLARYYFKWQHFQSHCEEVSRLAQNAYSELLLAYCHLENTAFADARVLLEKVLTESPKNTFAVILQGALLLKTGKVAEAIAALESVPSAQYLLGNYLKMQACHINNSSNCTTEAAARVLRLRPNDSYALYNEAESLLVSEQKRQAWDVISRGLSMDPNYVPLIELRSQLEGSF